MGVESINVYKTAQQQLDGFKKVKQDLFNIAESSDNKTKSEPNYVISIFEALALIEEDLDNRGILNG